MYEYVCIYICYISQVVQYDLIANEVCFISYKQDYSQCSFAACSNVLVESFAHRYTSVVCTFECRKNKTTKMHKYEIVKKSWCSLLFVTIFVDFVFLYLLLGSPVCSS